MEEMMATNQLDPRVFFAAERTLLAWLRTGLTIIGLGFVISRFGLFIQLLGVQAPPLSVNSNASISAVLGICFVVIGSTLIATSAIQHKRFVSTLTLTQLPPVYSNKLAYSMSMLIAFLGIALAIYLWFT